MDEFTDTLLDDEEEEDGSLDMDTEEEDD